MEAGREISANMIQRAGFPGHSGSNKPAPPAIQDPTSYEPRPFRIQHAGNLANHLS